MSGRVSQSTLRQLLIISPNRCAFPGCLEPIYNLATNTQTGAVCHIRARSPGGPRYDPIQTEEERSGICNLILLCLNHHAEVDQNEARYPVESLLQMKIEHEGSGAGLVEPTQSLLDALIDAMEARSASRLNLSVEVVDCIFGSRPWHRTNPFEQWYGYVKIRLGALYEETAIQQVGVLFSDREELGQMRLSGPAWAGVPWPNSLLGPHSHLAFDEEGNRRLVPLLFEPTEGWLAFHASQASDGAVFNPGPPPVESKLTVRFQKRGSTEGWSIVTRFTDMETLSEPDRFDAWDGVLLHPCRFVPRRPAVISPDDDW